MRKNGMKGGGKNEEKTACFGTHLCVTSSLFELNGVMHCLCRRVMLRFKRKTDVFDCLFIKVNL